MEKTDNTNLLKDIDNLIEVVEGYIEKHEQYLESNTPGYSYTYSKGKVRAYKTMLNHLKELKK